MTPLTDGGEGAAAVEGAVPVSTIIYKSDAHFHSRNDCVIISASSYPVARGCIHVQCVPLLRHAEPSHRVLKKQRASPPPKFHETTYYS